MKNIEGRVGLDYVRLELHPREELLYFPPDDEDGREG
jgi:hypothetical protein